ncbi:sensor histidine kinase [Pseudoxanthomonas taiwanensis]|uniref:Histidine kinase n=1 Tax=Pseudoxanthomonas taiwanensis TaxID=176598 RepID=A0A921TGE9_9GAMM|nr:histidine kinase [Pseudoxanthomonas taiwanensis]KAF1689479.1 histidine kinase [Pseudoxanthomonas taiwanensis]
MARTPTISALDTLWQAPVILWTILAGEGLAAILAMAPGVDGNRLIYFGTTSLVVQWVSLSTLGVLYLFRRPLARLRPTRIAQMALVTLIAVTALVCAAGWLVLREPWPLARDGWLAMFLRLTGIALVVGLMGLAAFLHHWRVRQLLLRTKQAEIEVVRARVRPHFLFNTLNTGAALVHQRPAEAEQLLLNLADLFRAALGGPQEVPLTEELALARRYLEIEGLRFGERLQVAWQLPDELPQVTLPVLSLQPLVENAIRHGIERSPRGGEIGIVVRADRDWLEISVRNPLHGTGPSKPGHQVGQSGVRARLHAMTHGRGHLETRIEDGHYLAAIRLPL